MKRGSIWFGFVLLGCNTAATAVAETEATAEASTSALAETGTPATTGTTETTSGPETTGGGESSGIHSTTGEGSTSNGASSSTSGDASSSGFGDSSSSSSSGDSSSSSSTGDSSSSSTSGSSSDSSSSGEPVGLPSGADCTDDSQCEEGHCYLSALGNKCGECSSDADCDFGCTPPIFTLEPPKGSSCNGGNLGDGCETDAACSGLECNLTLELPGIFSHSTCGECDEDADCMPGQVCNVDYDILGIWGVWTCVPTGSVGLGEFCASDGSGDLACSSGHCTSGDFEGLFDLGICSECEVDGDCPAGQSCNEPNSDPDGTVAAAFCG